MAKKRKRQSAQIGLFDQEMYKPVDLYEEPPGDMVIEQKTIEVQGKQVYCAEGLPRSHILIGSTRSCPVCGEDIKLHPDGVVRCTKCIWWQGLGEK